VKGKNWWEWVFVTTLAVLHVIKPSRGKAVVTALFGEIRPQVWVSDMLGSQRGHAVEWQVCLAHLLRDAKYAIDDGDTAFSAPFRRLLLRAIAIGRRREMPRDTTLKQYLHDLDRRLDRIITTVPIGTAGHKLHKRILANRGHLFVFMTRRDVPATNNVSERHLRPSVIFRKVTNGFRCE
jgi:transposase